MKRKFTVKHRYKWRQVGKILMRHFKYKRLIQDWTEYSCKDMDKRIHEVTYRNMIYGNVSTDDLLGIINKEQGTPTAEYEKQD